MKRVINLIKDLLTKQEEVAEATPYQFEYDQPIEGFDEFHETLNGEVPGESEPDAVVTPKGKRRRRAASSGVITA